MILMLFASFPTKEAIVELLYNDGAMIQTLANVFNSSMVVAAEMQTISRRKRSANRNVHVSWIVIV